MNTHTAPISALLVLALVSMGTALIATEEVSEQEGLECQVCHADPERSAETLTDQGLYYQYMRTLTGYEQVLQQFESCAYCHVEKAGARTLTPAGHRFRWMMEDMIGLHAWLDEYHPWTEDTESGHPAE